FRDLVARGLTAAGPVGLVTSDAHAGLVEAIGATLTGTAWQRCRTHYAANLMSQTPKSSWPWVKAMLHSIYDQPDAASMHAQFDRITESLTEKLPAVAAPRGRPGRHPGLHHLPPRGVAPDLVQQPPGTPQPRDPQAHRRRGDFPPPRGHHPPRRRRPGRATRRLDRATPLHRPRGPHPLPTRPQPN